MIIQGVIYNLAIGLYRCGVRVAAIFQEKPRQMLRGHSEVFRILKERIQADDKVIWVHAASLGEFEQGRPLIEVLRRSHPEYKILLSFFSPSGYEVRKNYESADVVVYLPFDTLLNAYRFVKLAHPAMAFFVKYEFWKNYLMELSRHNVPAYSISSIFRPQQLFFKPLMGGYRKLLSYFAHFYVQDEQSRTLLQGIGLQNVTVTGDTRFDRVIDINRAAKQLPLVEAFCNGQPTFVAGSSWAPDEDIFLQYFNRHPEVKLVVVPHVVSDSHLGEIASKCQRKCVRYTQATEAEVREAGCLLIDCYGLLSSIYAYGEIAYIGGGFGVGIHNVLEAAVYGIPVVFGPNNKKFLEAQQLLQCGGGHEVSSYEQFEALMDKFLSDGAFRERSGRSAGDYVATHAGATRKILEGIGLQ